MSGPEVTGKQNKLWRSVVGGIPVVIDVALSSAQPGLPDHFFFLPAGRQSGTVRPLLLHHRRLLLPNVRCGRAVLVGAAEEEASSHFSAGGGGGGGG